MWLLAVFFVSVLAQQCDSSWPSSVCPPASYLDQLNVTQRDQPSVRLCWEFFSTVSPYALLSAELVANLNRIGERFVNMRDFSERSLPVRGFFPPFACRLPRLEANYASLHLILPGLFACLFFPFFPPFLTFPFPRPNINMLNLRLVAQCPVPLTPMLHWLLTLMRL